MTVRRRGGNQNFEGWWGSFHWKDSRSQRFKDSQFQSFEVSKIHFMFVRNSSIPSYQIFMSCFLEYIDPILKVFINILHRPSGLFGSRLSKQIRIPDFHNFEIPKIIVLRLIWDFPWIVWSHLVSPKINNIGFGIMDTSRNRKIVKINGFRALP